MICPADGACHQWPLKFWLKVVNPGDEPHDNLQQESTASCINAKDQ
jgi:hypothetical protein